jgi:type I restriction enzyme R subunit
MTPEQKARREIDRQLVQCGWLVQQAGEMNISAGIGVAIREFPLRTGFADYLLYVCGKAIGVIEAKPEGHTLTGVETQSTKYTAGLPAGLPHYHLPLPFAYESTGKITQFTNRLDPDPRSREIFTFHRPEELLRIATLESQLRANPNPGSDRYFLLYLFAFVLESFWRSFSTSCSISGRIAKRRRLAPTAVAPIP